MTPQEMVDLFQKHVNAELAGDLDTTMATMSDNPHLNHVPTMAGGVGRDGVRAFYRDHLVGKFFPPDMKMTSGVHPACSYCCSYRPYRSYRAEGSAHPRPTHRKIGKIVRPTPNLLFSEQVGSDGDLSSQSFSLHPCTRSSWQNEANRTRTA